MERAGESGQGRAGERLWQCAAGAPSTSTTASSAGLLLESVLLELDKECCASSHGVRLGFTLGAERLMRGASRVLEGGASRSLRSLQRELKELQGL